MLYAHNRTAGSGQEKLAQKTQIKEKASHVSSRVPRSLFPVPCSVWVQGSGFGIHFLLELQVNRNSQHVSLGFHCTSPTANIINSSSADSHTHTHTHTETETGTRVSPLPLPLFVLISFLAFRPFRQFLPKSTKTMQRFSVCVCPCVCVRRVRRGGWGWKWVYLMRQRVAYTKRTPA